MSLTIGGDGDDWKMFSRKAQTGNQILFRSRTQVPEVRAYASEHQMARLRCVLAASEIGPNGLRFRGTAKAAPGAEDALNNLLNIIGRRNGALSAISIG